MSFGWMNKKLPGLDILDKEWSIPSWFVRVCIFLIFTVPATIYFGVDSFLKEEPGSVSFSLFSLFFGMTGIALVPVIGFLTQKSLGRRFGPRNFRFIGAIIVFGFLAWLAGTFFRDIVSGAISALRSL